MDKYFNRNLAFLRDNFKPKAMTQKELSSIMQTNVRTIQRWESGESVNMKVSTIEKLCKIFEVTPLELLYKDLTK